MSEAVYIEIRQNIGKERAELFKQAVNDLQSSLCVGVDPVEVIMFDPHPENPDINMIYVEFTWATYNSPTLKYRIVASGDLTYIEDLSPVVFMGDFSLKKVYDPSSSDLDEGDDLEEELFDGDAVLIANYNLETSRWVFKWEGHGADSDVNP